MDSPVTAARHAVMMPTLSAAFTFARVEASSTVLGARSRLSVRMRVNTRLVAPARLIIEGLHPSATPDNHALPLRGPSATMFGGADPCDALFGDHPVLCDAGCSDASNTSDNTSASGHEASRCRNATSHRPNQAPASWGSVGSGNWHQHTGRLTLMLRAGEMVDAGQDIVFALMLVNPGNTSCLTAPTLDTTNRSCEHHMRQGSETRVRWDGMRQLGT